MPLRSAQTIPCCGATSYRVDHLSVQDLLAIGQPWVVSPGEGAHHPQARRRQAKETLESGEVLTQVSNHWRRELRRCQFRPTRRFRHVRRSRAAGAACGRRRPRAEVVTELHGGPTCGRAWGLLALDEAAAVSVVAATRVIAAALATGKCVRRIMTPLEEAGAAGTSEDGIDAPMRRMCLMRQENSQKPSPHLAHSTSPLRRHPRRGRRDRLGLVRTPEPTV